MDQPEIANHSACSVKDESRQKCTRMLTFTCKKEREVELENKRMQRKRERERERERVVELGNKIIQC